MTARKDTIIMKKATKIALISVIGIITVIAIAVGAFFIIIEPDVKLFKTSDLKLEQLTSYSRTVTVLDVNGDPVDESMYDNNKLYVRIDDLRPHTVNAFIAIEDKRFFKHNGIDYKRLASAFVYNIKSGSFKEGASTITQQLIKNTHLTNEKTIKRKIVEMRLARKLERIYSKDQILESYFNILYFGSGIRGLGTASRVMFGRSASELTLAQSAALASIINNPSGYNPYSNYDNLIKRKNLVLRQMLKQGYISKSDYTAAVAEKLTFDNEKQNQFVSALLKNASAELKCSEKELFLKNYTLKTSYDPKITDIARNSIKQIVGDFYIRILVLDNSSGGIVCDETNANGYINPKRSPASTIKPFIAYAPALENGLNPMSQILDAPAVFGDYSPQNYRNVYRGYQSLTDSLKYSSNIAAVKLVREVGIDKAKSVARSCGLPFEKNDNSLSVALGGMEKGVTLLDLANAYRTLANGGVYSEVSYFTGAYSNHSGAKSILRRDTPTVCAVSDDTAYLLTDMLTECARTGTAKKLKYSGIIAAKTGTNGDGNGNRDCYCIAYTPINTIAVWFGAKNELIPNDITGATCCGIVKQLCDSKCIKTDVAFEMPSTVAYYEIDLTELNDNHNVFLADPLLPKRYRRRALFSKRHLPIRKSIDIIDYYDRFLWNEFGLNGNDLDVADRALD